MIPVAFSVEEPNDISKQKKDHIAEVKRAVKSLHTRSPRAFIAVCGCVWLKRCRNMDVLLLQNIIYP